MKSIATLIAASSLLAVARVQEFLVDSSAQRGVRSRGVGKTSATFLCLALVLLAQPASAGLMCTAPSGVIACTGTLSTPEDIFTETFTLATSAAITVQSYGFGGGTNADGTMIAPGGFDSMVGLFSGTATAATILESAANPIASADNFGLYSPACPPADAILVGTVRAVCGDNTLSA